jgi:hypothetical protein
MLLEIHCHDAAPERSGTKRLRDCRIPQVGINGKYRARGEIGIRERRRSDGIRVTTTMHHTLAAGRDVDRAHRRYRGRQMRDSPPEKSDKGIIQQQAQTVTLHTRTKSRSCEKYGNSPACKSGRGIEGLTTGYLLRWTQRSAVSIQANQLI